MLHIRFLYRELIQAAKQAVIFTLCVALSLAALVALSSFRKDVDRSLSGDARALQGGDIIIHSHYPFSAPIDREVAGLVRDKKAQATEVLEFYTVTRPMSGERTLLSRLKVVKPGYPLYGRVDLQSGRPLGRVLQPGFVCVQPEVLGRLGVRVGDRLHIGSAVLTIADVVSREPGRPVELFSLGPEIFVSSADLERLQLLGKGSRVQYSIFLKVHGDDAVIDALAARLTQAAAPSQERVTTYRTADSGIKRFFDNLFFFLSLISIFTLFLFGIGIQTSLTALLREKEKTIATIKAIGAANGFLLRHFLALVLFLGLIGSLLGIAIGFGIKQLLPHVFTGLLPADTVLTFSMADSIRGLLLGLPVVFFFAFLPLYGLRNVKPTAIFRNETTGAARGVLFYPLVLGGLLILTVVVVIQLRDVKIGLYFMASAAALIAVVSGMTFVLLALAGKIRVAPLGLRQALRSLFRPGNATRSIVITLASALSVLLTIFLVQANLTATYIESYPPDAPNLFFIDIQPDQEQAFLAQVGEKTELFPIVRARLTAIDGHPVKDERQSPRQGDSLTREFNLTYRDTMLPDEKIPDGGPMFVKNPNGTIPLQVSILDTVAEMGDMHVGDILDFNIQGMPLSAKVTSIRTRTRSKLFPFFYFVFPEQYLRDAPQTSFAALHIDKDKIASLENRVVSALPNISFINMTETAAELGELTRRLTSVVNFFAGGSMLAGVLIMIGSILATRLARIREAVYYKVLGAGSRFVTSVFFYEHLLLGLLSSLQAVVLAEAGSWALCRYLFDIGYRPHWPAAGGLVAVSCVAIIVIGGVSSMGIIRQKPASILREQEEA